MEKDQKYLTVASLFLCLVILFSLSGKPESQSSSNNSQSNNLKEKTMENEQGSVPEGIEGLKVEVLQEGKEGPAVESGDKISVYYTGSLEDGTIFDSNVGKKPFSTPIGSGYVIKGWDLGMIGMKIGEKRKLTISSDLGYGETGNGPKIPGGATLIFEVELVSVE